MDRAHFAHDTFGKVLILHPFHLWTDGEQGFVSRHHSIIKLLPIGWSPQFKLPTPVGKKDQWSARCQRTPVSEDSVSPIYAVTALSRVDRVQGRPEMLGRT